jgi:4'-phosphopantetheinyl transferase
MEVWAAYRFLHQSDEKELEKKFARLPAHITEPVYRYRNPVDRTGRMISRILLETLIRKYFPHQGFSWDDYRKDASSKPYFKGSDIHFSSTHHEEISMVCVSSGGSCGIDSEVLKPIDPDLYSGFLHPEEKDFINSRQDPAQSFYDIWTRKEAVLKASGLGISCELNSIDAHAATVAADNHLYYTTPVFLPGKMVTHIATPEVIRTLHLEEFLF